MFNKLNYKMSSLQAGHTFMPHLGTSVHPSLKQSSDQVKKVQASTAQRIFDTTMALPDMGMNERKAAFRVAATGLQGPKLTSEPRGGFTSSKFLTHTRIGASVSSDGLEASVRPFETYFSGDAPTKFVGPTTQHTTLENPVYQTPEEGGKVRSKIGSMSLARMDAEIQAGEKKRQEHYKKLFPARSNDENEDVSPQKPPPVLLMSSLAQPLPQWRRLPSTPDTPTASMTGTALTAIASSQLPQVINQDECLEGKAFVNVNAITSKHDNDRFGFGMNMNRQSVVISTAFSAVVLVLIIVIIVQSTARR